MSAHFNNRIMSKRYQHDSSETLEDRVIFSATDGFNTADGMLKVQVITKSVMCFIKVQLKSINHIPVPSFSPSRF